MICLKIFPVAKELLPIASREFVPIKGKEQSDSQTTQNITMRKICVAEVAFVAALQHYYLDLGAKYTLVSHELYTLPKPWKLKAFRQLQLQSTEKTTYKKKFATHRTKPFE
jgi:hypothetical protein